MSDSVSRGLTYTVRGTVRFARIPKCEQPLLKRIFGDNLRGKQTGQAVLTMSDANFLRSRGFDVTLTT